MPDQVEVVRVSGEDIWQRFQAWREQGSLRRHSEAGLPKSSTTHEVKTSSARSFIRNMIRNCEGWYYHPDLAMPWIKPAVSATAQVCQKARAKVIWATGGPWSSFVIARKVSLQTGVPYVLDFRDSWTLALPPFEISRPEWAKRRDRGLLFQLFKDAQAVTFRYHSEAECYWRAYPGALEASRVHIIPNGFDGTIEEFSAPGNRRGKCKVLYAGTVTPYRYDTLLQGMALLKKSYPLLAKDLELLFVGEGTDILAHAADTVNVSDIVKCMLPVSYADVCRLQEETNALLLLGMLPTKGYELCGSKVFSYLKAGRPIIGIVPQDEMKNVLHRVGVKNNC